MANSEIYAYTAHYLPLLSRIMQQMELPNTINKVIDKEDSQATVDTGTIVAGLILNILSDSKIRLYLLPRFFEDKPMPLLFPWNPEVKPSEFNEDRAGRVLDEIYAAGAQKVFSAVSGQGLKLYDIGTDTLHVDTTSKSFYGVYDVGVDSPIEITRGFSKDHRPDLKQILFGVGTVPDGIPVVGEIRVPFGRGNQSDMKFNGAWHPEGTRNIRQWLEKSEDEFLLYIGDSAAVTAENLSLFEKYHVDFISRLPERYSIAEGLTRRALARESWEDLGTFSPAKEAASYRAVSMHDTLEGREYRFVVVYSSKHDKRKLKALEAEREREYKKINKKIVKLSKKEYFCEKDARQEATRFLDRWARSLHRLIYTVVEVEKRLKRNGRGRPSKDAPPPQKELRYKLKIDIELDQDSYQRREQQCGIFILITSLLINQRILEEYKGQPGTERIFRFIKDPTWVGAYCLKNPERIVAFGYLILMAALVYAILERQVRRALEDPKEPPIEGLNRIKTKKPTSYAIKVILTPILVVRIVDPEGEQYLLASALNENQTRVLRLAGFDQSIYSWKSNFY